jgi:hypothetical protein
MRAAAARSRRHGYQQLLKTAPGAAFRNSADRGLPQSNCRVSWQRVAGRPTMKTLTIAAAMLALIVMPAQAQMAGKRPQGDGKKTDEKKPVVDEKAYKAALERIPDSKEKYDPWRITKPAEPAKKPN